MIVNTARTVSEALYQGLNYLRVGGIEEPSRNGPTLTMPHPVMTVMLDPTKRVLFSPVRDANPFFHLMEALWMLAGRNDLPWLAQFNKRMAEYSDDGGATQPGAYGYRWRNYFGYDQLETIIVELKNNPTTRRAVLTMWDSGSPAVFEPNDVGRTGDLMHAIAGSKDVPCNTHVYFNVTAGYLDMTVCCRSNDIWWGAHGANAVHFSFLLEYVSAMSGVPMGVMRQFSNDYHIYTNVLDQSNMAHAALNVMQSDRYMEASSGYTYSPAKLTLRQVPLIDAALYGTTSLEPLSDIQHWLADPSVTSSNVPLLTHAARPMWFAWQAHKAKDYGEAIAIAEGIRAEDWRIACTEWLQRREAKHKEGAL